MDIPIFIIQFLFGIGLFFIINWIGRYSYSIGYIEISMFVKTEDSIALNFLIRILTPIVYIIITSTILYYLGLDNYVKNIFLVNIYYILVRLIFNLLMNRRLLINWNTQFLYWVIIILASYFTYDKLIRLKTNILPDLTTIANELWIIILIFIYQIINTIKLSNDKTYKRIDNYLSSRYEIFEKHYGKLIKETTQNDILEAITYAVLIYEDFNRPRLFRILESIYQMITKKTLTLGIMQVRSKKNITDYESVKIGTEKIMMSYQEYLTKEKKDCSVIYYIINEYNGGTSYQNEVYTLFYDIKNKFYGNTTDNLDFDENQLYDYYSI